MSYDIDKVTPRPWEVDSRASTRIVGPGERGVASAGGFYTNTIDSDELAKQNDSNAAYIVHCVNAHDTLVEALKFMTRRYEELVDSGDCGHWNPRDEVEVQEARAALALAKEGKE